MEKLKYQRDNKVFFVKKIKRIMKLITLFLFVELLYSFTLASYSQNTKLSISAKDVTFQSVINQIEEQSEFLFFYNIDEVDIKRKVSVKKDNSDIYEILNAVVNNTGLTYAIRDRHIVLINIPKTETIVKSQQGSTITGTVVDEMGDPLPGVNVMVKGILTGVITDIDGKYSINVSDKNTVLIYSFIGYQTQEIRVGDRYVINVRLNEQISEIDEVVVVGYGKQRKVTLTGSISTLKGKEIQQSPAVNISNNIVGRMTGVIANNRSGEPGNDWSDIFIRGKGTLGDNSPLYVIDGVANRGNLERLNPSDVESVTVLKDASAAIYGAQAANGVILITTKRGETGKPVINYDGNFGVSQATRLPKLMNGYQYMVYKDEANRYDGLPEYFGDIKNNYLTGNIDGITLANTNWMDYLFRDVAPQTQHSISARGGNDRVKYFISGAYLYQEPLYKSTVGNNYNTLQLRSNIDASITKDLTVNLEIATRREDRFRSNYDSGKIFMETFNVYPYVPAYYPNGLPSAGISKGLNSAILTTGTTGYYKNIDKFINTKVGFNLNMPWLIKGLSALGYIAFDSQTGKEKTFNDRWDAYQYVRDDNTGEYIYQNIREETNEQGSITLNQGAYDYETTSMHLRLSYEKKIKSHNVSAFVAYEQSKSNNDGISAYRRNFLTNQIQLLSYGGDELKDNSGWANHAARQNVFSRVEYDYNSKYLASFTIRFDGSCNFPPGKRWGTFPSLSTGWRISEENFIKDNFDFMDNLKLRASWGIMGNDRIAPFQHLATYNLVSGANLGENPTRVQGFNEGVTPNTNITWETIHSKNIGIEGTFWKDMLSFDLNYFHARRTGILIAKNASVPSFTAISLPAMNLGKVNNQGIEIELGHRNKIRNVNYYINGNMTFARNKVVYMDEAIDTPEWQKRTGYSMDSWTVYMTDGIYQSWDEVYDSAHLINAQPGDIRYLDIDNDDQITSRDMVRIHQGNIPQIIFGVPMGMSWKGIDLNILWQGQGLAKQLILPQNLNIDVDYYNGRWISATETPNSKYPRAYNYEDPVNDRASQFWLKDASFLRLKSVELAYNFNSEFLKKRDIMNLRLYVSGFNLLCFDKIKIMDPESASTSGNYYPQTRVFNVGVNLSF